MAAFAPTDVDVTTLDAPPAVDDAVRATLNVETKTIDVNVAGKSLKIHTEQASGKTGQSKLDVLFLHGQRFSSKNWVDIDSVSSVAAWGYRGVAVDLPGYGQSSKELAVELSGQFLKELISTLGMQRPVIVSPSMSGSFSLPYLFGDGAESTERTTGYVPVAPIYTTKFQAAYKKSQLPTLVVCGTNDTMLGAVSTSDLMGLPKAKYAPIEGAGHACYLNNPAAFHTLLYHFLKQL